MQIRFVSKYRIEDRWKLYKWGLWYVLVVNHRIVFNIERCADRSTAIFVNWRWCIDFETWKNYFLKIFQLEFCSNLFCIRDKENIYNSRVFISLRKFFSILKNSKSNLSFKQNRYLKFFIFFYIQFLLEDNGLKVFFINFF